MKKPKALLPAKTKKAKPVKLAKSKKLEGKVKFKKKGLEY